jgi:hypothetical protein
MGSWNIERLAGRGPGRIFMSHIALLQLFDENYIIIFSNKFFEPIIDPVSRSQHDLPICL